MFVAFEYTKLARRRNLLVNMAMKNGLHAARTFRWHGNSELPQTMVTSHRTPSLPIFNVHIDLHVDALICMGDGWRRDTLAFAFKGDAILCSTVDRDHNVNMI